MPLIVFVPIGFSLSPEWESNGLSLKSVTITGVDNSSVAQSQGLHSGDEIVLVNDTSVTDMGWSDIECLLETGNRLMIACVCAHLFVVC